MVDIGFPSAYHQHIRGGRRWGTLHRGGPPEHRKVQRLLPSSGIPVDFDEEYGKTGCTLGGQDSSRLVVGTGDQTTPSLKNTTSRLRHRPDAPELMRSNRMSQIHDDLTRFIEYAQTLDGDEKGEAQVFCDR